MPLVRIIQHYINHLPRSPARNTSRQVQQWQRIPALYEPFSPTGPWTCCWRSTFFSQLLPEGQFHLPKILELQVV